MDFRLLQRRLLAHLRARVRSGEITERGLARLTGLSQPHLHNVLKGVRFLSMETTDQILRRLQIDMLQLPADEEEGGAPAPAPSRRVPFLEGAIGPGHPYPQRESRGDGYPFQAADLQGLESPVAAWLAPDPHLAGWLSLGGVMLLDRSESRRSDPDEESYYALDLGGESAVRRLQRAGKQLYLRTQNGPQACLSLSDRSLLSVVKGRVSLLVLRL
jgi:transcriptional regulator with XRE-family HTH domain